MNPQAIVARPPKNTSAAQHYVLKFDAAKSGLEFLRHVRNYIYFLSGNYDCGVQVHLGLTYKGLETLDLPAPYLRVLARNSPAFAQGAAIRAPYLGDTLHSAPECWPEFFAKENAHAILSFYGKNKDDISAIVKMVFESPRIIAGQRTPKNLPSPISKILNVKYSPLTDDSTPIERIRRRLTNGTAESTEGDFVHFGYRDGLTSVGFNYPGRKSSLKKGIEEQWHEPGEFLLGRINNDGRNPWALSQATDKVKAFFLDASFGILRQMEQDVASFEAYVSAQVDIEAGKSVDYIKAKLCGRYPDGSLLNPATGTGDSLLPIPLHDADKEGFGCPFGAHIRRMNPRSNDVVHLRQRPLIRRGMPYGVEWTGKDKDVDAKSRGLMGLFFCASIEEQFEHLVGSWADRLPMGFKGAPMSKDPLMGTQEASHNRFEIPLPSGAPIELVDIPTFVTTRGMIYAIYLGAEGLSLLLSDDLIKEDDEEDQ
jgi:hypothetical protein